MQENSNIVTSLSFQLNDTEVTARGLSEETTYLYRAIIEDAGGKTNTTGEWYKVKTPDCQQIGNF
jgi:hypothetical protein